MWQFLHYILIDNPANTDSNRDQ